MISDHNLQLVRKLVTFLYHIRVIPFTWNSASKRFELSTKRYIFSYIHLLFAVSHALLPFYYISSCAAASRRRSVEGASKCNIDHIIVSVFSLLLMLVVIQVHIVLLTDPPQLVAGHNLLENFVAKIKSKNANKTEFKKVFFLRKFDF